MADAQLSHQCRHYSRCLQCKYTHGHMHAGDEEVVEQNQLLFFSHSGMLLVPRLGQSQSKYLCSKPTDQLYCQLHLAHRTVCTPTRLRFDAWVRVACLLGAVLGSREGKRLGVLHFILYTANERLKDARPVSNSTQPALGYMHLSLALGLTEAPGSSVCRQQRSLTNLLFERQFAPCTKRTCSRVISEQSTRCIESWAEGDSLKRCSATYCQLTPPPRSTIAAAFSPDGKLVASTQYGKRTRMHRAICLIVLSVST